MNTELERLKGEIEGIINRHYGCEPYETIGKLERTAASLLSIALELDLENRKLKEEKRSLMEELHGLG